MSFLIVPLIYLYYLNSTNNAEQAESILRVIIILFISVIVHEFGHTLTALRLGIQPKDIIISAFGGLARMNYIADKPKKEFFISLAGPFINLLVSIVGFLYLYFVSGEMLQIGSLDTLVFTNYFGIAYKVVYINFMLFILNLIPAFPMDGGRALRALLSLSLGIKKATIVAISTGLLITLYFIILGIREQQYYLILLSVIIYFFAAIEFFNLKSKNNSQL